MARPRTRNVDEQMQMTTRVSRELAERIDTIGEEMGVPRSDVLRSMLEFAIGQIEAGEAQITVERTHVLPVTRKSRRR